MSSPDPNRPNPQPEERHLHREDGRTDEEFYASRAKSERKMYDNRTGRRTRKRSGPGPPDPRRRVPFDPDALLRNMNPPSSSSLSSPREPPLYTPKPARMFSNYVFGGEREKSGGTPRTPANPNPFEGTGFIFPPEGTNNDRQLMHGAVEVRASGSSDLDRSTLQKDDRPNQNHGGQLLGRKNDSVAMNQDVWKLPSVPSNCESSPKKELQKAKAPKSRLTRYIERKMGKEKLVREAVISPGIKMTNKIKMKIVATLACSNCKKIGDQPIFGCLFGHPMCSPCQRRFVVSPNRRERYFRFRCASCNVIDAPVELRHVNEFLQNFKYMCYCGSTVTGDEIRQHQQCTMCKRSQPKRVLLCEQYGASNCEFCGAEGAYSMYVDHLFREHFSCSSAGRANLSNEVLVKMQPQIPLFESTFNLPLEPPTQKMSVMPSMLAQSIVECEYGTFTLHQTRVEQKQLMWNLSFEKNPDAQAQASQFQARLKFEAIVKNRVYRKICNSLIYPIGKDMDENIFLDLIGRSLPDVWTPTFKFAYTHKATLNICIYESNGRYVRKSGRTQEIAVRSD